MTLLRKATIAGLAPLFYILAKNACLLALKVHGLQGVAGVAQLFLVGLAAPMLILQNWLELHKGIHVPTYWGLLVQTLFVIRIWSFGCRVVTQLKTPYRSGRRAFLVGAGLFAASGYGVAQEFENVEISQASLALKGLPPSLEGLRIILLSDLHRGPVISRSYLDSVVDRVNALNPDVVLLPGDFVSKSSKYFEDVTVVLSRLRPRIGSFATLGNHDHWEGAEAAKRAIARSGVLLLTNRSVHINTSRVLEESGRGGICFAGVDDLGEGRPDLAAALSKSDSSTPCILLSHNPDFAEEPLPKGLQPRIDLQVSGHTHGGQIVLPGAGPFASGSRYGLKYISGWAQGPHWPVYITRGIGTSLIPVRVGAAPEIVVFDLKSRSAQGDRALTIGKTLQCPTIH